MRGGLLTMVGTHGLGSLRDGRSALGLCAFVLGGCKGNAQPQAPPPPEVSVIEVKPRPVTVYDEYVAQTQAPDTIEIRSQVTGLLERQAFADGARVKKGDVLYVIDQRPFEAQLAQAKASLAQAEANLVNAKQNLARNSRLIAQKAVSQQDYDTAVAQERSSAALVEAQKALLRNVELNLEFATLRALARWLHEQLAGQAGFVDHRPADAAHDAVFERPDVGELQHQRGQDSWSCRRH